jgi:hypothetical protein
MKRKAFFVVALLVTAAIVPLIVINAQAVLSAGPDQQVYVGDTVMFNGTTTENVTAIIQVTWDFGDNTTMVNGTDPALLNATHVYAMTGVFNATLTVKFDSTLNTTETANAIITVIENQPPIADAGPDQYVEQLGPLGANVTLDGTASSDPDEDTLTYNWTWTGGSANGSTAMALFPPGNTTVTLTVSDGEYNSTDTVNIIVQDTTLPIVNAGSDVTVEQESHAGTEVVLNGTATNTVSTRFNFTWSEDDMVLKEESNVTDTTLTYTFNLGVHEVMLNATDDAGNTGTDTVTVTVVDTIPPEVDAGPDVSVEQESHAGTEVTLSSNVTDICSTEFDFVWSEDGVVLGTDQDLTYTFNLGTHVVMLNATDMGGNTGTDTVTVTVVDTIPPEVDAGPDVTVEAGFPATIHGSATDICSTEFDFVWSEDGVVLGTDQDLTYTFNLGTHVVMLNATDMGGNTGTDTVVVTAVDTTPPEISVTVTPNILWPPNHKYADVEVTVTAFDVVDPSPTVTFVSMTSNEPENGKGDGNTSNDMMKTGDFAFKLRAERSGTGSGRVYTITYKATDASGNYAMGSVTIEVPHNK